MECQAHRHDNGADSCNPCSQKSSNTVIGRTYTSCESVREDFVTVDIICFMYLNKLEDIELSNPDFRVGKE